MSSQHDRRTGTALALLAVAVLSPDSLIVRTVGAADQVVLFWRGGLLATAMLLLITLARGPARTRRGIGGSHAAAGVAWALATILFVYSVRRTEVASTLAIVGAGPLFAATIERLALHDRIPMRTWVASAAVAGGLVVIFAGGLSRGTVDGDLAALAGSLSFATFLALLRHGRTSDMRPSIVIGGSLTAIVAAVGGGAAVPVPRDLALLALLGLVILPVSLVLTMLAARRIRAAEVALLGRLETILGPLWVWLVLDDAPPIEVVAAGAIIVAATTIHSVLAVRAARSRHRDADAPGASAEIVDVDR